jgi:hypothetical protein
MRRDDGAGGERRRDRRWQDGARQSHGPQFSAARAVGAAFAACRGVRVQ